jgi:hypothetical protein
MQLLHQSDYYCSTANCAGTQLDATNIDGRVATGTQAVRCDMCTDSTVNAGTQEIR